MQLPKLLPTFVKRGKSAAAVLFFLTAAAVQLSSEAVHHAGRDVASYIIASANTRSHLTDEDAWLNLESFEQRNAVAVADHMACSLTRSAHIADALGVYANSAENSLVIETDLTDQLSRYVASLFGRYAHQEYVLLFVREQGGPDKMWVIDSSQPLPEIVSALRSSGLVPATVRRDRNRTEVLVVDFGAHSTERLGALASSIHGSVSVTAGAGALIGKDNRERAAALFDANIHNVEQKGKYHLSSHLWTRAWHDATSRTCSSSISVGGP